jgi:hypothetical protein
LARPQKTPTGEQIQWRISEREKFPGQKMSEGICTRKKQLWEISGRFKCLSKIPHRGNVLGITQSLLRWYSSYLEWGKWEILISM